MAHSWGRITMKGQSTDLNNFFFEQLWMSQVFEVWLGDRELSEVVAAIFVFLCAVRLFLLSIKPTRSIEVNLKDVYCRSEINEFCKWFKMCSC